jgi:DMSO/TMAO reductase YedYZ molybdopterin-dependent catalytic subunit
VSWDELGDFETFEASEVAGGFAGEAVRLAGLIDRAHPLDAATHCTVASDDGHYRASIPLNDLRDKGWLIFRLDGEALPRDQGGPLRLVVPEGRTLCWNVKAVIEVRFTEGSESDSVPANPPH